MTLRWLLAATHLLALGIGMGAVWTRARALRRADDPAALRGALEADAWWGVAALLWLGSGLWRLLSGTEKGTEYYLGSHLFWLKMVLFVGIVAMELRPAVTLMRWRRDLAARRPPETGAAARISRISYVQGVLVALMVLVATAMARGYEPATR